MTTPRLGPDREDVEWWIEISLKHIAKEQKNIEAGERDQAIYTSMYLNYMDLGRSRYMHGIWFLHLPREAVKDARAAFQKAAECIEMSFRMAYDPALPEYLGNQADWSCVMETDGIEGFYAAFMASDFALARRFAPWPRRSPDNAPMGEEACNYVDALQAYLRNDLTTATQLLNRNLDKFKKRPSSKGFRLNYHTLSMTLLGIVEKNAVRFNGGLAAQLEFYERFETGVNSENEDTSQEFICDDAVALANLGLWAGLKLQTQHRLMPTDLLISAYPPISK
ncbi:MAG: immunity 49 family protein [Gammaproteobacteria bacterium]|nr:immunity 49 family protein [Gammaproteobacteria bacterium]